MSAHEQLLQLLNENLNARLDDLKAASNQGFAGVHERLDKLNGKTAANEKAITEIKTAGKTVSVLYGGLISLLGLIGGCSWAQANISIGTNSPAKTEQPIPSNGGGIVR